MNKQYYIIMLVFISGICWGQNLVPNGDFESYSSCPDNPGEIDSAVDWFNPSVFPAITDGGSPEYYNQCSQTNWGVPCNFFGCQLAHSGIGYAGLSLWSGWFADFREYIEVRLLQPLVADTCYQFEMYCSLADNYPYTTDAIEVHLSNNTISGITNYNPLPLTPQIVNTVGNMPDSSSWLKVRGDYLANGGEEFLIIGNFRDDSTTNIVLALDSFIEPGAYIYIDDVSLTTCNKTSVAIEKINNQTNINIYPNPFSEKINIHSNGLSEIKIYDLTSRKILQQEFTTSTTLNLNALPNGVYIYELKNRGTIKKGKLIKE